MWTSTGRGWSQIGIINSSGDSSFQETIYPNAEYGLNGRMIRATTLEVHVLEILLVYYFCIHCTPVSIWDVRWDRIARPSVSVLNLSHANYTFS